MAATAPPPARRLGSADRWVSAAVRSRPSAEPVVIRWSGGCALGTTRQAACPATSAGLTPMHLDRESTEVPGDRPLGARPVRGGVPDPDPPGALAGPRGEPPP